MPSKPLQEVKGVHSGVLQEETRLEFAEAIPIWGRAGCRDQSGDNSENDQRAISWPGSFGSSGTANTQLNALIRETLMMSGVYWGLAQ
jgi:hypothetical protein